MSLPTLYLFTSDSRNSMRTIGWFWQILGFLNIKHWNLKRIWILYLLNGFKCQVKPFTSYIEFKPFLSIFPFQCLPKIRCILWAHKFYKTSHMIGKTSFSVFMYFRLKYHKDLNKRSSVSLEWINPIYIISYGKNSLQLYTS